MIEIIEGLPDNIVGVVVSGRLTNRDCTTVLVPAIEKSRVWHYRLRLYYEIRSRYPGATWDDIALGLQDAPLWERVAVMTDVGAIRHAVKALRLMLPGEVRVFALSQVPEGLAWITAANKVVAHVRERKFSMSSAMNSMIPSITEKSPAFWPPSQYIRTRR